MYTIKDNDLTSDLKLESEKYDDCVFKFWVQNLVRTKLRLNQNYEMQIKN